MSDIHLNTEEAETAKKTVTIPAKEFVRLTKQVANLRYALERIRDCDWVITLPDRMDAVRAIAREALEQNTN